MICRKPVIHQKSQPSALKIALLTVSIIVGLTAIVVVIYNFFKKHFKISFEYDCDGNCENGCDACNDELFSDCDFCPEWEDSGEPEIEEDTEESDSEAEE